jgi:hypothetical protein
VTSMRIGFLKGFAAGFILLAIVNAMQVLTGSSPMPQHLGAWIDLAVECALVGFVFGAIAGGIASRKQESPDNDQSN